MRKKILLLFALLYVISFSGFSATSIYTSKTSGDWTSNGTWTTSAPATNINNQTEVNVLSSHTVQLNTDLTGKNKLTVNVYGTLIISGNISAENNLYFNVASTGTLILSGNLSAKNTSDIIFNGNGTIAGSITVKGGTDLTINGDLTVSGNITGESNNNYLIGSGDLTFTGSLTGFDTSGFTGSINGALPVVLTHFSAEVKSRAVLLKWETASEENSDYFIIERSSDMKHWQVINETKAAGYSSSQNEYGCEDAISSGTVYYRLKQLDYDGSAYTYEPVSLQADIDLKIEIYPNPATEYIVLKNVGEGILTINNIENQTVSSAVVCNQDKLDVRYLPNGVYSLVYEEGQRVMKQKLIIKK